MPRSRAGMQPCDPLGSKGLQELGTQEVGEEMMIAVPVPLIIERHQEEIRPFQVLKDGGRSAGCRQFRAGAGIIASALRPLVICYESIAEGSRQALQDRGLQ